MDADHNRLENGFYLSALRMFVLQTARRAHKREGHAGAGSEGATITARERWHMFLDCLCKLCDAKKGGGTTTAVAVEQEPSTNVLWLAMNYQPNLEVPSPATDRMLEEAQNLLCRTLETLEGLRTRPESAEEARSIIFRESVWFCREKVREYRKNTLKSVSWIGDVAALPAEKRELLKWITEHLQHDKDDQTICKDVYEFCRSDASAILRHEEIKGSTAWRNLRHNIGRLCCWYKAATYLVKVASDFADILSNIRVDVVPRSHTQHRDFPFSGNVDELFSSTGFEDYDLSLDRLTAIFGSSAMTQAEQALVQFLHQPKIMKLHAEVSMADFFFVTGRSYLRDIRYIGCSKDSCYCCDLYFSVHPSGLVRRRCHGRIYVKWQLSNFLLTQHSGSVSLERMMLSMGNDIKRTVMSNAQGGYVRTFDSTTGMVSMEIEPRKDRKQHDGGVDSPTGLVHQLKRGAQKTRLVI